MMRRSVSLHMVFLLAIAALGTVSGHVEEAAAADRYLSGSLATGVYTTEHGGIIAQGACVVDSGVRVTLVADRFTFGPGFEVRTGGSLATVYADYDGLSDEWEIEHFGTLSLHGPNDDPDGDGANNLIECTLRTDPNDYGNHPVAGLYYIYDALGRLSSVYNYSGAAITYGINYQYDAKGNRTSMTVGTENE